MRARPPTPPTTPPTIAPVLLLLEVLAAFDDADGDDVARVGSLDMLDDWGGVHASTL